MDPLDAKLLHQALIVANGEDWRSPAFTMNKSYACSVISELTYHHITELEIKDTRRSHLVPSYAYQLFVALGSHGDFNAITAITSAEIEQAFGVGRPFVLESDNLVVAIVPARDVVFVAVRGTESMADWITDLHLESPREWPSFIRSLRFHEGFLHATFADRPKIKEALSDVIHRRVPVCFTGHSLGGAISSILYLSSDPNCWTGNSLYPGSHQLVTFGAPRFSNKFPAVVDTTAMHHVRRGADLFPVTPPEWLGYRSTENRYAIDSTPRPPGEDDSLLDTLKAMLKKAQPQSLQDHSVEGYRRDIARHAGIK